MDNTYTNTQFNELQPVISQRVRLATQKAEKGADHKSLVLEAIRQFSEMPLSQALTYYEQIKKSVAVSESLILSSRHQGRVQCQKMIADMDRDQKLSEIKDCFTQIQHLNGKQSGEGVQLKPETLKMIDAICQTAANSQQVTLSDEQITSILMECYEALALLATAQSLLERGEQLKGHKEAQVFVPSNEALTKQRELAVAIALNLQLAGKLPDEMSGMDIQQLSDVVCFSHELGNICDQAAAGHLSMELFWNLAQNLFFVAITVALVPLLISTGHPVSAAMFILLAVAGVYITVKELLDPLFPAGILESKAGVIVKDYALACKRCARDLLLLAGNKIASVAVKLYNAIMGLVHPADAEQAAAAQPELNTVPQNH